MGQNSSARDSKIAQFGKNSSYLKGFEALLLFGSPVVGIGSVLFTLLVVLILLSNSSSHLTVSKITFQNMIKKTRQVICVNQLLSKAISYGHTCPLWVLWVSYLESVAKKICTIWVLKPTS